jgi:hypothetical protein
LNRREGISLATARASESGARSTAWAAACSAPTLAAQTPCTDSVSMGGAAISPWIMLAKPGISASPPEEPLARKARSPRARPAWARQSSMACTAMAVLLCTVRPSPSMA